MRAMPTIIRTSNSPMENSVVCGSSTIHFGRLEVVMVRASEYSTRKVRKIASVPSVTMIDGTRP